MTTSIPCRTRYDLFTRTLHWIIAVGIIYASVVGYAMHYISDPVYFKFFSELNMSLATLVTLLMVIRFVWRFFRPAVPYGDKINRMAKGMIVLMHELFYLIIFAVLISGYLMLQHGYSLFWLIDIPQPFVNVEVNRFFFKVHRISCIALVAMLTLHVLAVIKHHLSDKNPVLSRML